MTGAGGSSTLGAKRGCSASSTGTGSGSAVAFPLRSQGVPEVQCSRFDRHPIVNTGATGSSLTSKGFGSTSSTSKADSWVMMSSAGVQALMPQGFPKVPL
jgi:hypothetical protein